jgi:hypothetical protein
MAVQLEQESGHLGPGPQMRLSLSFHYSGKFALFGCAKVGHQSTLIASSTWTLHQPSHIGLRLRCPCSWLASSHQLGQTAKQDAQAFGFRDGRSRAEYVVASGTDLTQHGHAASAEEFQVKCKPPVHG